MASLRKAIKLTRKILRSQIYDQIRAETIMEGNKIPKRHEVINYLIESKPRDSKYLEIGVRDPVKNFDKINCSQKYGVDPGVECDQYPVDI